MASLFDNIFKPNNALPLASLFSQDSKFRSAQAAPQAAEPGSKPAETNVQAPGASLDHKSAGKKTEGSKKRKASALEANEPAITTEVVEPVSNTAKSGKRHSTPSVLHKSAKYKGEQPQVPAAKASESKPNQNRKAIADGTALNLKATASKALGKQKRAAPARGKNVEAVAASTATVPGLSSAAESASEEHDIYNVAEEQAASQKLSVEEQAERLRRTVFVGNLPASIQRKSIRKEFSQYGDIESIRMRSVPVKLDAKMSRRAAITTGNISKERGTAHAYIVFQQEDSAVAALASNMHVLESLHIRVDRAGQSAHGGAGGNVVYERNRTVFVGNLPFDVEDEELIVLFNESCTKLGIPDPVDAVRVVRDSSSQLGKGFGFVQFSSQQAARAALGCDGQLLRKRPVRVTKAMKVSANLKQLGQKPGRGSDKQSGSRAAAPAEDGAAGVKRPRSSNKAVAALQRKSQPTENWQGFKTKGAKKTVAGAAVKNVSAGQRPVPGKRKAPEKRASVAARKQKSKPK